MRASIRVASQFRQPLIKFIGKRQFPSQPDVPHPHPQAPPDFQRVFGAQSSSTSATAKSESPKEESLVSSYSQFWEAPPRYWNYRAHVPEDAEIESIMSGGASST
ncbi:hypothetical protein DFP72DRAFT_1164455 [Ephemerocybe angulata]|uniref:Uncharacterized protein n=1 Tax=Ephemerocybe angulata TaxID=980116 RepID=A0A8H6IBK4_9AGAR|nr:hypothetical protein DFP72DRAFT_1164455 [Tulosesus angulatus]